MPEQLILDASSGLRMMWFDKDHPGVVFLDQRDDVELSADKLAYELQRGRKGSKKWNPKVPTVKGDFRKLDYPDETFPLIVWDPPHCKWLGEKSLFKKRFGALDAETWPDDIKRGAAELWRVLKLYGVLIFKWNDHNISHKTVLKLFPAKPLFGQVSAGAKNKRGQPCHTFWFCFMKIPKEAVS